MDGIRVNLMVYTKYKLCDSIHQCTVAKLQYICMDLGDITVMVLISEVNKFYFNGNPKPTQNQFLQSVTDLEDGSHGGEKQNGRLTILNALSVTLLLQLL